jgi:NSS family neurotransmitter:Na+ symporter
MSQQKPQEWGSRLGVILAVAGSAVGLGNFLRFPGKVAENGGGAFMIPYFCALLFLGIPIGWAEWSMARYGGRKGFHSAPGVMGVIGKGSVARYFGVIGVLIPLGVYFYYVLIESWCLSYAFEYLTGGIGIDPSTTAVTAQVDASKAHFAEITGAPDNGVIFRTRRRPLARARLLARHGRRQLHVPLPGALQGHRILLQVGDARDGRARRSWSSSAC